MSERTSLDKAAVSHRERRAELVVTGKVDLNRALNVQRNGAILGKLSLLILNITREVGIFD